MSLHEKKADKTMTRLRLISRLENDDRRLREMEIRASRRRLRTLAPVPFQVPWLPRPWLGWVMLLEDCPKSRRPVSVAEPHFPVLPDFRGASYAKRYELLLRKLVLEKLYDRAAFLMATEAQGRRGEYTEPATDLSMRTFLVGLAGHVATYVASI
jgi:hypothetical protein